ncbi:MAG: glycosyltransferase [Saprospiraceae bacterium]|nr:glycosyltransferase [Candidatus Vicinibacter affinis]
MNTNSLIRIHDGTELSVLPNLRLMNETRQELKEQTLPEILFISSYPPRECGIATYSQDLIKALNNKFSNSFSLKVCALQSDAEVRNYPEEVKYILDPKDKANFFSLAQLINKDKNVKLLLIQHEFGLFPSGGDNVLLQFIQMVEKPSILVFHTVLPNPEAFMKDSVNKLASACSSVVVMTKNSAKILKSVYGIQTHKIEVIQHGTHLVPHLNKETLKLKYGLQGRKVLSTFGLLNSGKSIETTLDALPLIVKENPDVLFLVIGKTHPGVILNEGESYRKMLEAKVVALGLQKHVSFINYYLPLEDLLEYLQLTDIYLFTSKDPHQAVSGTFAYAMSCGCPIISTPIPHAKEVLRENTGILIDFQNDSQLSIAVNRLMSDETLRTTFSLNVLQRIVPTSWENAAISHALLFMETACQINSSYTQVKSGSQRGGYQAEFIDLQYRLPELSLDHINRMTDEFGIIQFALVNQPDQSSGYTLDDNARALIAMCMHFKMTHRQEDLLAIRKYLNFIQYCQQEDGRFLNYVDIEKKFTAQNESTNCSDSTGRAIWALGYLISCYEVLPAEWIVEAKANLISALPFAEKMHSTRSMSFIIKGLFYSLQLEENEDYKALIKKLADRLVQMYRHEAENGWQWFEGYLTYANSIIPEAMLCAWSVTGDPTYKEVAKQSFDFLLSMTFDDSGIKVISNKTWLIKDKKAAKHGEQPIDVAYTILGLDQFYQVYKKKEHLHKMAIAFNWFMGNNHLHQIMYNPCTGGCYDGLEETQVNLNQGAESTISYLMARITVEKYFIAKQNSILLQNKGKNKKYQLDDKITDLSFLFN